MLMSFVVVFCLTLMLLSVPQRDWLVRRARRAQAALRDLRRAVRLPDYTWMIDEGVPQLEQACAALRASDDGETEGDTTLAQLIRHQARTLLPVMGAHLRLCRDVASLLDAAALVEPLPAEELHTPWLRRAARVAAWGRRARAPLLHLRLHLTLLHWGLGRSLTALGRVRLPLAPGERRRIAERGADVGRLARASTHACAALLRSPTVVMHEPPAGHTNQKHLM